jgi:predicted nuclease with TOPRIM domain
MDAHYLKLKKKITALGSFIVPFLYKELKKEITVKIEQDPEEAEKLAKKKSSKTAKAEPEEEKIKKTREEIMAEKEETRKIKKEETLKRLKEKFKD